MNRSGPSPCLVGVLLLGITPLPAQSEIDLLASTALAPRAGTKELPLGGISGLVWDATTSTWLAVSDDSRSPRAYRFTIELEAQDSDLGIPRLAVRLIETILLTGDNRDAEAIAAAGSGGWFIAFERPATITRFDQTFSNPMEIEAARTLAIGLQPNKTWESIALMPTDPQTLLLISELGAAPTAKDSSRQRRSRAALLDPSKGKLLARGNFLIPLPPSLGPTGIVDIEPIDRDHFLSLQRSYTLLGGWSAAIDLIEMRIDTGKLAFERRRLLSLGDLAGTPRGNFEAMALGPRLADGSRLLVLMSDDNFGRDGQANTLVVALRFHTE